MLLDFDPIEEPLRTSCGQYGWKTARVAHRETYAFQANWKLAVENYVECYHCGPAHTEYSQIHALEMPPEMIEQPNLAMEARTCALGMEVGSGDHWQNSRTGGWRLDRQRRRKAGRAADGTLHRLLWRCDVVPISAARVFSSVTLITA